MTVTTVIYVAASESMTKQKTLHLILGGGIYQSTNVRVNALG